MSLLFRVVFASAARSTHHKLALDALRHLRGPDAQDWMDLFLRYYESYLEGAKAPDDQFKDFRNHVLHVRDNYWGGAIDTALKWYDRALTALKQRKWEEAVYAAGVLSHYYSDPLMPFHTGQSEAEGAVHRALEWSICKSYGELQNILDGDLGGYPRLECPKGDDWLPQMIRGGAEKANPHYETCIDHYDVALGVKNPLDGMDQEIKDRIAACLGHAVVGFARILERLVEEAHVDPPIVDITLKGVLAALKVPIRFVLGKIEDHREREQLAAIYDELQRTGKVVDNLPADEKEVRRLHAQEVLGVELARLDAQPARAPGGQHGQGKAAREQIAALVTAPVIDNRARPPRASESKSKPAADQPVRGVVSEPNPPRREPPPPVAAPFVASASIASPAPSEPQPAQTSRAPQKPAEKPAPPPREQAPAPATIKLRFFLDRTKPIQDAPSIGNKTAERMRAAGVGTVGDLLSAEPDQLAQKLSAKHITGDVIRQWQAEASLCCRVPELRGHDAQILVACGVDQPQELAEFTAEELLDLVQPFVDSPDGQRVLRGGSAPDLAEVRDWISWGKQARPLKAA